MVPKGPYKVHSLSKHIEDTQKGLSASAQYNKRPGLKFANAIKMEPGVSDKSIFGNNMSDDDDSDDSSSSSGDEGGSDFLRKLAPQSVKPSKSTSRKQSTDKEIADSDDERKAASEKMGVGRRLQPMKRDKSSEDGSSDEAETESEANESEGKVKVNRDSPSTNEYSASESGDEKSSEDEMSKKKTTVRPSPKDEPSESESESEGDVESGEEKQLKAVAASKGAMKLANGTATSSTSETSSSEEESNDEEEQAAPAKTNKKRKQPSSDESVSETYDDNAADESMHITDRKTDNNVALPNFVAPDFILRKSDDGANGQDVAQICSQANLQGKQVWYFTVPANVPISVVQNLEIPMNQSKQGDGGFSHDGESYSISFDSMIPKSSIQILIPSTDGSRYQPVSHQVNQVMHIKKVAQLGNGTLRTLPSGPLPKDPPRAQPRGMKARYKPFGVKSPMGEIGGGEEYDVEGDVDMANGPMLGASSGLAKEEANKGDYKKNKDKVIDSARKGKRKPSSEDDAAAATEQLLEENLSAKSRRKKQKMQRDPSPDLGSDGQSTSTKKSTFYVPSSLPSSQPAVSIPAAKLKNKMMKTEIPSSTPRQSVVPIPVIAGSSQPPKVSPVPIPQVASLSSPLVSMNTKTPKKKEKKKAAAAAIKQSPPPSAQGTKSTKSKVTPVPPPKLNNTS